MPKAKQYVGPDVSLKETTIAVIDENDKVWRGSVASTPEAITEALKKQAPRAERIGLEAGQLSSWLYHGLQAKGCPVTCHRCAPRQRGPFAEGKLDGGQQCPRSRAGHADRLL
jgi:hypothetical protein